MPLQGFLDADSDNLREGIRVVTRCDSRSLPAVDAIAAAFQAAANSFGPDDEYLEKQHRFNTWARENHLSPRDAFSFLSTGKLVGAVSGRDAVGAAQQDLYEALRTLATTYQLLRLERDFFYGASDILKNRVTPGLGYLRLQCETLGTIALFRDEPRAAVEWLGASAGPEGRNFYKRYHTRIISRLAGWKLRHGYDLASANSLHSRVGGVAYGIEQGRREIPRDRQDIRLVYQEVHDPTIFFLWFAYYLRQHERIVTALLEVFENVAAEDLRDSLVPKMANLVEGLWETLQPAMAKLRGKGLGAVVP